VDSDPIRTLWLVLSLPGPGRNLGRLYVHLGNKFIDGLGKFLARRGHGPDAAAEWIARLRLHSERDIRDMHVAFVMQSCSSLTESERIKLEKTCRKLVRYSRSRADSTAISACNHIADLALFDPYLKQLLFDCLPSFNATLVEELQHNLAGNGVLSDVDPLLASSRKALISVTEVGIQKIWSEFYVASTHNGLLFSNDMERWYACIDFFIPEFSKWFYKDISLSFLSLRHLLHTMQMFSRQAATIHDGAEWAPQTSVLVIIVHQLLNVVFKFLTLALSNNSEVLTYAIDWDTLEALLGREGEESAWATQLRNLTFADPDLGDYGDGIFEQIDAVLTYETLNCATDFSCLCRQHGRKWIPPI